MNTKSFIKFADNLLESNLVSGIQGNPFDYGAETMDPLTALTVGGGLSGAVGGAALLNRMRNKKAPLPSKKPTTPKPRVSPALRKAREELAAQAKLLETAENNFGRANKELNMLKGVLDAKTELLETAENNLGRVNRELAAQRAAHAAYVDESQKALNILNKELDTKSKFLETAENHSGRVRNRYYDVYGKPGDRLNSVLSKSSDKASKVLKSLFSKLRKVPYIGPASLALSSAGLGAAGMSMANDDPPLTAVIAEQEPKVRDILQEHPELLYYGLPALLGTGAGGLFGGFKGALGGGLLGTGLGALTHYLMQNPEILNAFKSK